MREVIKNILREQDNINSQEDYDKAVDKAREEREAYRTGPEFERRLRALMSYLQTIGGLDTWIGNVRSDGPPRMSQGNNTYQIQETITNDISKIFGGTIGGRNGNTTASIFTLIKTFINNGGYERDFREGEVTLESVTIYDVDASTTRKTWEHSTSMGVVYGVDSEQEAIDSYTNDPIKWEQDTEHEETEYGDIIDISNVKIFEKEEYTITPALLGL